MVVYADILILVNLIVDYFLILISARFLNKKPRLWRLILSSVMGGFFSLYIFLPQCNFFFQSAVQVVTCMALCVVAFGFESIKSFLRSTAVLFCVNFAYSGAMIAIWLLFKPYGMVINNSVVYFDISPLFLILFSVLGYFICVFLKRVLQKNFSQSTYCEVVASCCDKKENLIGIVDTGNSLKDVFGLSQIFITSAEIVDKLLGDEKQNPTRFRKIPCGTVAGECLLDGYRIDCVNVLFNNKKYNFKNPVLAVSTTQLKDCEIIVNPENLI